MSIQQTIIEAGRADHAYWRDVLRFRELFQVLAWRDISVRYKQTAIGVAWAVVRPIVTMVIFTIVFGRLAKLPSDGSTPYALLVLCATLPWMFFSSALSDASNSIIDNANLIGKVYFPRVIIPLAAISVAMIDFLVSVVMLIVLMAWYQFVPDWRIGFLPLFVALMVAVSVGPGLWLASLNAKYRDFRYIIPFLMQVGLFASPIGFSSAIVPEHWRLLYSLNPMVGVIDGFRWALLGGESALYWPGLLVSIAVAAVFLWLGIRRFRAMEKTFADVL